MFPTYGELVDRSDDESVEVVQPNPEEIYESSSCDEEIEDFDDDDSQCVDCTTHSGKFSDSMMHGRAWDFSRLSNVPTCPISCPFEGRCAKIVSIQSLVNLRAVIWGSLRDQHSSRSDRRSATINLLKSFYITSKNQFDFFCQSRLLQ